MSKDCVQDCNCFAVINGGKLNVKLILNVILFDAMHDLLVLKAIGYFNKSLILLGSVNLLVHSSEIIKYT